LIVVVMMLMEHDDGFVRTTHMLLCMAHPSSIIAESQHTNDYQLLPDDESALAIMQLHV
jgi:hypothetical protein